MEIYFWAVVTLTTFGYVGYPITLALITPLFRSKENIPLSIDTAPMVSILVAAYNEEKNIANKLDSLLSQSYPASLYEIWVLNDGSDDATASIVERYRDKRVNLLNLPRGGKAAAINAGISKCVGEIVVFSDADNEWTVDTLVRLISPFAVSTVGAVSGKLSIKTETMHLGLGDMIYRELEGFIRKCETRIGSAVSADGGIFAIRKELYETLPQDVTDDFFISTAAVVHGKSIVYQESAVAYDSGVESAPNQLRRRIRVTVRGMTSLWRRRELFNPLNYGAYSFCLFSHKLLRRLVPIFAITLFFANLAVFGEGYIYKVIFALQVCFYLVGVAGLLNGGKSLPKIFSTIAFVLISSYGLLIGVLQFLTGKRYLYWSPDGNR